MLSYATDEHTRQDAFQSTPIEENRRSTDIFFTLLIGIIFFSWFGICIKVLSLRPSEDVLMKNDTIQTNVRNDSNIYEDQFWNEVRDDYVRAMDISSSTMKRYYVAIPISIFLTGAVIFLYVYILKIVAAKLFVFLGLLCIGMIFLFIIIDIGYDISYIDENNFSTICYFASAVKLLYGVYLLAVMFSANKVNTNNMAEIIRETYGTVLHYPAMMFFSFIINMLAVAVIILTVIVLNTLIMFADMKSNIAFHCINLVGGIFLFNLIMNFGVLVLSDGVTCAYWTLDGEEISPTYIFRTTKRTFRNHLGTISLVSTSIVPKIWALLIACKLKRDTVEEKENPFIKFFCRISLIYYIGDFALIKTSIYGYDFKRSTEKVFNLISGNSALFVAGTEVGHMVRTIGILISFIIGSSVVHSTINKNYPTEYFYTNYYATVIIVLTITSVVLSFHLMMDVTLHALLTYRMTMRNSSKMKERNNIELQI